MSESDENRADGYEVVSRPHTTGDEKLVSVEDEWLMENGLDVGSEWPLGV